MNNSSYKKVFIIAAKESYEFLGDYLMGIFNNCNLNVENIMMPYQFKNRDLINMNIDHNSHNFLIESDEYIRNSEFFNSLDFDQIQDLRIIESKKRAHESWLNEKKDYSKEQIKKSDICLIIINNELNKIIKKELKVELNIAKQLNKKIIHIEQNELITLNKKIMTLKQKNN